MSCIKLHFLHASTTICFQLWPDRRVSRVHHHMFWSFVTTMCPDFPTSEMKSSATCTKKLAQLFRLSPSKPLKMISTSTTASLKTVELHHCICCSLPKSHQNALLNSSLMKAQWHSFWTKDNTKRNRFIFSENTRSELESACHWPVVIRLSLVSALRGLFAKSSRFSESPRFSRMRTLPCNCLLVESTSDELHNHNLHEVLCATVRGKIWTADDH